MKTVLILLILSLTSCMLTKDQLDRVMEDTEQSIRSICFITDLVCLPGVPIKECPMIQGACTVILNNSEFTKENLRELQRLERKIEKQEE